MEYTPQVTPDSTVQAPSLIDASAVDANLKQIRSLEATWGLPALPDTVKLDLAGQAGVQPHHLAGLLNGISSDLAPSPPQAAPYPQATGAATAVSNTEAPDPSILGQLQVVYSGLANLREPTVTDVNAVGIWKQSAIDRGYLQPPPDGQPIDESWDPSFNTIRHQMLQDDATQRYAGERPGAMSTEKVMGAMNDWMSPSGLLRAGMNLDLLPNIPKYADRWDKLIHQSDGVGGFVKNVGNVLWGTATDVALPLFNDFMLVMMATGVGEAYNFARLGTMEALTAADSAAEGTEAVRALYSVPKFFQPARDLVRATDVAADMKLMRSPGIIAQKLGAMENGFANTIGAQMESWRRLPIVYVAKAGIRAGMQAGLLSKAEQTLRVNNGYSLTDAVGKDNPFTKALSNPLIMGVGEALLTPYSILQHGSLSGPVGSLIGKVTGKTAQAAAEADTVAPQLDRLFKGLAHNEQSALLDMVPTTGDPLATAGMTISQRAKAAGTDLRPLFEKAAQLHPLGTEGAKALAKASLQGEAFTRAADNPLVTREFHEAAQAGLKLKAAAAAGGTPGLAAEAADRVTRYNTLFQSDGAKAALKDLYGLDDEQLGAAMTWATLNSAIDRISNSQSNALWGKYDRGTYHVFRNRLISQLRQYEPDDVEGISMMLARSEATDRKEITRLYNTYKNDASARNASLAGKQDQLAEITVGNLISTATMPSVDQRLPVLQSYLPQVMDTFGNWSQFNTSTHEISELWRDGTLDGAPLLGIEGPFGGRSNIIPEYSRKKGTGEGIYGTSKLGAPPQHGNFQYLDEDNPSGLGTLGPEGTPKLALFDSDKFINNYLASPLAAQLSPTAPTVARLTTKTGQDFHQFANQIDAKTRMLDAVRRLRSGGEDEFKKVLGELERAAQEGAGQLRLDSKANFEPAQMSLFGPRSPEEMAAAQAVAKESLTEELGTGSKATKLSQPARDRKRLIGLVQSRMPGPDAPDYGTWNFQLRQLESEFSNQLNAMHQNTDWNDWGLPQVVQSVKKNGETAMPLTPEQLMRQRTKQLHGEAQWHAREIDLNKMIADAAEGGPEHDALTSLRDGLARDGYKMVHGVEFLQPHELGQFSAQFGDYTAQHMNQLTMGNWFNKTDGVKRAAGYKASLREALIRHLSPLQAAAERSSPLSHIDLSPDGADVKQIIDAGYQALWQSQGTAQAAFDDAKATGGFFKKAKTYASNSGTPVSLPDLPMEKLQRALSDYPPEVATALYNAAKESRALPMHKVGLYAIESKLRASPNAISALKLFGKSRWYDGLTEDSGVVKQGLAFAKAHAAGALVGGAAGAALGDGNPLAIAGGAAAGAVGQQVGGGQVDKVASAWLHSDKVRYAYLADHLASLRDQLRFSLSPFFDLGRMTEAHLLSNTAVLPELENGEKMVLPFNNSPGAFKRGLNKRFAAEHADWTEGQVSAAAQREFEMAVKMYRDSGRGNGLDMDALDGTAQWFNQTGLLGHSPIAWQSTMHNRMLDQMVRGAGLGSITNAAAEAPEKLASLSRKAFESVRDIHTYGLKGRSALEQSTNFIFFPFSFQKKMLTHMASFVGQDISRGVMLQDAYKLYSVLDDKYDLNKKMHDYLPVMDQLSRVNNFSFGLSLGQLGGINRPFEDWAIHNPISAKILTTMFSPIGVTIKDESHAQAIKTLATKMLPAWNDINILSKDLASEGHVITSPKHMTEAREADAGYTEWHKIQSSVQSMVEGKGYRWSQMGSSPDLEPLNQAYKDQKAALMGKYPGWASALARSSEASDALAREKQMRLSRVNANGQGDVGAALGMPTADDAALSNFEDQLTYLKQQISGAGMTMDNLPPDLQKAVRASAFQLGQQVPGFQMLYRKFYERDFGPLERNI